MASATDFGSTEIAILLTTCDKYNPGNQTFRLQNLVGLKENSNSITTNTLSKSNLLNKDSSNIPISSAKTSSVITLNIPYNISRTYPTKFIPPGTRFIVAFSNGDITKPVIIGGEF
jgi:hypothetical protein